MKNQIPCVDLIGKKLTVGDTVIAHIQNRVEYVKIEEVLDNGLLKTNKQHYCLFPNKVILMEHPISQGNIAELGN